MSLRRTYLLKNSKSSEIGAQAAEQIFSSLPYISEPLLSFLPGVHPDPISFEIVVFNQVINYQINVPEEHDHYLRGQLIAAYPGITIEEAPEINHTFEPLYQYGKLLVRNLRLTNGSFYPLKTYADFAETDPLSAVLGTLSKMTPGQSAVIQLLLSTPSDRWKNKGFALAEGYTDKEGKHVANPDKELITSKLNQTCHRYALTIATSAPESSQAMAVFKNIQGSYSAFNNAKSNSFTAHKPFMALDKLVHSLPHRNFKATTKQYLSIKELASLWHMPYKDFKDIKNLSWGRTLLGEPPENLPTYHHTPEEERGQVNYFATAEYKNENQVFGIKDQDRRRHMYIIGKSGTGKSTMLANMIINDLKRGKGVAVIDPHGDLVETVLDFIPSDRINDVVYLNPADPEYSVRLNLLEDKSAQFKELIASGIIAIFKKLYAHSWGPRLEYILRNTLLTLVEKDQATLEDIMKLLTNKNYLDRTIENLRDPVLKNFWQKEWGQMQDRQRTEAIAPILNKIGQFVTSPLIRNVINSPSSSFSIEDVMNDGKILLCNLSQGKLGEDNAAMLGAMLITKVQLAAMSRVYIEEEKRRDFILYVDEFQNFATTSFIKILSEARKYRLSLILANQYVEQIEEDVRAAIFGNCGTLITFLVGAADADLLSHEFGQQYTPEDLVSISKHQIVLKLMVDNTQSLPFPAFTLPPASATNTNREKVIRVSNERYAKKKITYDKPVNQSSSQDQPAQASQQSPGQNQHHQPSGGNQSQAANQNQSNKNQNQSSSKQAPNQSQQSSNTNKSDQVKQQNQKQHQQSKGNQNTKQQNKNDQSNSNKNNKPQNTQQNNNVNQKQPSNQSTNASQPTSSSQSEPNDQQQQLKQEHQQHMADDYTLEQWVEYYTQNPDAMHQYPDHYNQIYHQWQQKYNQANT